MRQVGLLLTLALLLPASMAWAQTGRISGAVTDAATGESLPGVNVSVEGTTLGSITDADGFYSIINVRPGTHSVRASFVGFTPAVAQDVSVNIGQTTDLDFALQEETVGLEEVVVTAARPVVQRDVSASVANIDSEQMENLPVASVADVISLQAGFEPGLTIRGSGGNQVGFALDGVSLIDPRTNNPNTEVSYTAIDEVQVQTGGFNAEYGNVRSGLINVITKAPDRRRYTADVITRYSPPTQGYNTDFGTGYGDPDASYWAFSRLSRQAFPGDANGDGTVGSGEVCEVSICGTGILPSHMQTQYAEFGGWRAAANGTPYTAEQLRAAQEWVYRKDFEIQDPDYEVDGTITGPVPGIGPLLGDLRFSASFRQAQDAYLIPSQRSAEQRRTFQGKLVSDVGRGMQLELTGIHNRLEGIAVTHDALDPTDFRFNLDAELPGFPWDNRDNLESNISGDELTNAFGDYFYSPHDATRSAYGLEFTHTISPNTFYEVQVQRNASEDLSGAPDYRAGILETGSPAVVRCVTPNLDLRDVSSGGTCAAGEFAVTDAPFGYNESYEAAPNLGAVGENYGSQEGDARDSSNVVRWVARLDVTSQVSRFMQLKTGAEVILSDFDVYYGSWDPANPHQENQRYRWERSPVQGALYGQTKLEFRGMVANIGLRADYFHAAGEWYDYDPFGRIFTSTFGFDALDDPDVISQEATERSLTLSPRLGVSFPVTDNSKFYFNYGHFRQMPDPYRLFEIQYGAYTRQITRIGNPDIALPKTVAYELGFEQNIADQFLVRLAGFYRDLSDEGRDVTYISTDGLVNYTRQEPLGYGDNRGFEVTLQKDRGDWIRGFINYTYLSSKNGGFGYDQINENRREFEQFVNGPNALEQNERVPEPYANMNLELRFPQSFGPNVAGIHPLANWRLALLGEWRSGAPSTWDGTNFSLRGTGNNREISYNVAWKDYWMFDLRLSKAFGTRIGQAQFFVDLTNVFDLRQMYWRRGMIFQGANDNRDYFRSLHLPSADELFDGDETHNPGYTWVPGDDRPGDYRKPDAAFDPIYAAENLAPETVPAPIAGALYYDLSSDRYMTYSNGNWSEADANRVDQVLDDKAYIDMPNNHVVSFLNPRNVYFGFRLSF